MPGRKLILTIVLKNSSLVTCHLPLGELPMTILHPQPMPAPPDTALPPPLPRADPITRLPILILFPHSRCNCRCLMCDIWRAHDEDELAAADVARWLDEWRALGVQRVVLSGGEALLHSHLWELCDHLRAAGIGITILSTGLLLRRHAAELVRRCDDVVVSLDGPREIHDHIRNIPRAYEKLAEGVAAVKAAGPQRVRSPRAARCSARTFGQLRATVAAAHELGLDRISFLAADVSSERVQPARRLGRAARDAAWRCEPEDLPLLAAEIDALEREYRGRFRDRLSSPSRR